MQPYPRTTVSDQRAASGNEAVTRVILCLIKVVAWLLKSLLSNCSGVKVCPGLSTEAEGLTAPRPAPPSHIQQQKGSTVDHVRQAEKN